MTVANVRGVAHSDKPELSAALQSLTALVKMFCSLQCLPTEFRVDWIVRWCWIDLSMLTLANKNRLKVGEVHDMGHDLSCFLTYRVVVKLNQSTQSDSIFALVGCLYCSLSSPIPLLFIISPLEPFNFFPPPLFHLSFFSPLCLHPSHFIDEFLFNSLSTISVANRLMCLYCQELPLTHKSNSFLLSHKKFSGKSNIIWGKLKTTLFLPPAVVSHPSSCLFLSPVPSYFLNILFSFSPILSSSHLCSTSTLSSVLSLNFLLQSAPQFFPPLRLLLHLVFSLIKDQHFFTITIFFDSHSTKFAWVKWNW